MAVMTKTPSGEEIVILSRKEFDRFTEIEEDLADIRAADAIMAGIRNGTEELFTSKEVDEYLAAKTPLAFWRKRRGMTQADLAAKIGLTQGFLSEIEAGKKTGDVKTLQKVAAALGVTIDHLSV